MLNSMEEDLNNAKNGFEPDGSGILEKDDETADFSVQAKGYDDEDEDIIRDDYQGNIINRRLEEEKAEESREAAQIEIEQVEDKHDELVTVVEKSEENRNEEIKRQAPASPDILPRLGDGSQMAALQKKMGGIQPVGNVRRKIRMDREKINIKKVDISGIRKKKLMTVLVVMVIVVGLVLFAQKTKEGAEIAKNAKKDPFANVKNYNDAIRMRNLTTLADIAAVYHIEEKADLPVSKDYVRLNEVNPVSDFFKQALERYEMSENLLADPDGPDSYYAYRSEDGLNIELSARLEDKTSYSCMEDPCIFKKTLTEADIQKMSEDPDKYK